MEDGTCIILDDWAPRTAVGGRNRRLTADDLKAIFTTHEGLSVSTRYGDTTLACGPRIVTSNEPTLSLWHPSLTDGWKKLTNAQRLGHELTADGLPYISPDGAALFKRIAFAFVDKPLISNEKRNSHLAPRVEEHAKRARVSYDKWLRPSPASSSTAPARRLQAPEGSPSTPPLL